MNSITSHRIFRTLLLLALSALIVSFDVRRISAAEPTLDPAIDWAAPYDPRIASPASVLEWPEDLPRLWRKALEHAEADLQREAADSITRAHQLGMPASPNLAKELADVLAKALDQPGQ